jgi:hydroxypyruvate isomerase
MNYTNIFKHIYNKGYKGSTGYGAWECKSWERRRDGINKAYREADSFK